MIKEINKDLEGKPAIRKDLGYAIAEYDYVDNYCKEIRYYDENKKLTINSDVGYAVLVRYYNKKGQLDTETYYDDNGGIVDSRDGYAKVKYVYDFSGNIKETVRQTQEELKGVKTMNESN